MIRGLLLFTLAAALACAAQTAAAPAPSSAPAAQQPAPATHQPTAGTPATLPRPATDTAAPSTAAAIAPTQPVVTIDGICSSTPVKKTVPAAKAKAAATPCKTVITKAEFEKLLDAARTLNANLPPTRLAQTYVDLLAMNKAAQKAGIEKDPKFNEFLRLVRMNVVAEFYQSQLQNEYRNPPAAEVQSYYNQNLPKYEEIKLSRIFIPTKNTSAPDKDDSEKKAEQVANDIHDRAAKGEDFEKLQKEAYTTLGLTIMPPNTSAGTRRRGALPAKDEQELFALKPGEVSAIQKEPAAYIIYKLDSRQTLPLDQVKTEISNELYREKMQNQIKSVMAGVHADFNEKYFGPPAPTGPVMAGPPRRLVPPGASAAPKPAAASGASTAPASTAPSGSAPPASSSQTPPK